MIADIGLLYIESRCALKVFFFIVSRERHGPSLNGAVCIHKWLNISKEHFIELNWMTNELSSIV